MQRRLALRTSARVEPNFALLALCAVEFSFEPHRLLRSRVFQSNAIQHVTALFDKYHDA